MKKYIEAALLPVAIILIATGIHDKEAICCIIGGFFTGIYVFIQNEK